MKLLTYWKKTTTHVIRLLTSILSLFIYTVIILWVPRFTYFNIIKYICVGIFNIHRIRRIRIILFMFLGINHQITNSPICFYGKYLIIIIYTRSYNNKVESSSYKPTFVSRKICSVQKVRVSIDHCHKTY